MSKKDYYQVLEVGKTVSQAEIKKAYHKLAMQYHPDRNTDDNQAEKKFKEVNEAYDVLKDEQKRAAYDRFGHSAFQAGGSSSQASSSSEFHNVNDVFGDLFGDFMSASASRPRTSSAKMKGSDLKYNITISLEEAFTGINKNISFATELKCDSCQGSGSEAGSSMVYCDYCQGRGVTRVQQGFFTLEQTCSKCLGAGQIIKNPCKKCQGIGRYARQKNLAVNIPLGIEDSTRIRLVGEGEAGVRGGGSGDLYIFVAIKPHDIYRVDGSNLHCRLPISFTTAALGGELRVPLIDGRKILLKILPGTQNGDKLKLKGEGMTKVRSSVKGDMLAQVHVEIPKILTKKQKDLLESLAKEFGDHDAADETNFFNKMKSLWK